MLQVHLANFITHIQQLLNKSSKHSDLWEENLHTPDSLIASASRNEIVQLLNTAVASLASGSDPEPRQKVGRAAVGGQGATGCEHRVLARRAGSGRHCGRGSSRGSPSVTRPGCPGPGSAHRAGPARPRPPPLPAPRRLPRNPSREAGTARRGRGRRAGPGPQGRGGLRSPGRVL